MRHAHDLGLAYDLKQLVNRRRALRLLSMAGLGLMAACKSDSPRVAPTDAPTDAPTSGSPSAVGSSPAAASCVQIPPETGGPFPGDGSNGPNILAESGVVRSDIRSSIAGASGTAGGVPLTMNLVVVDFAKACAPIPGAAVYLWHCDREGRYSMYSQGAQNENYLRGVQQADAKGLVTFRSVFPGAYAGRWPHVHFEVFRNVNDAIGGASVLKTSQLALPQAVCEEVYATSGYEDSVRNLQQTSLDTDNVFRDGYQAQLATVTGDISPGLVANLTVGV